MDTHRLSGWLIQGAATPDSAIQLGRDGCPVAVLTWKIQLCHLWAAAEMLCPDMSHTHAPEAGGRRGRGVGTGWSFTSQFPLWTARCLPRPLCKVQAVYL